MNVTLSPIEARFFSFGRKTALVAGLATGILVSGLCARADEAAVFKQQIQPSLAFVITPAEFGTSFCISSDNTTSYFLTANHVVEGYRFVDLVLAGNPGVKVPAEVVAREGGSKDDTHPDIAILKAGVGNVPVVQLAPINPDPLTQIAIAGYPWFDITQGRDPSKVPEAELLAISPSAAPGSVSSKKTLRRFYIEYDAKTGPGNSGGPLFDLKNGAVYGVVEKIFGLPNTTALEYVALAALAQVKDPKKAAKLLQDAVYELSVDPHVAPVDLATSMSVVMPIVQAHPELKVTIAPFALASETRVGFVVIDEKCELVMDRLGKAYSEWTLYRSILKPIYDASGVVVTRPQQAHRLSAQARVVASVDLVLERRLDLAARTLASSDAYGLVPLAKDLVRKVKLADSQDQVLVAALGAGHTIAHPQALYQNTANAAAQAAGKLSGRTCARVRARMSSDGSRLER